MRKSNQKTIQHWQQHVEAFRASGLTRAAYSKREHIRIYQLDYWRRKLSRLGEPAAVLPVNQWVSMKINDEPARKDSHIDLWIGRVRVEIRKGFDSQLLTELIRMVDSQC
jgi:hypothetical protein